MRSAKQDEFFRQGVFESTQRRKVAVAQEPEKKEEKILEGKKLVKNENMDGNKRVIEQNLERIAEQVATLDMQLE